MMLLLLCRLVFFLGSISVSHAWQCSSPRHRNTGVSNNAHADDDDDSVVLSRRHLLQGLATTTTTAVATVGLMPPFAWAEEDEVASVLDPFNGRDRKGNKEAVIRDDYWFMTGKTPPRLLTNPLRGDDPQWNAFGSCTQADGGNSCTYVPLSQRIPAYSKYGSSIAYGARDFQRLGQLLVQLQQQQQQKTSSSSSQAMLWQEAISYVDTTLSFPPTPVDAELKLVLLATALTTSPNFPQPGKELLVARFYANEVRFANRQILFFLGENNLEQALAAWEFGRDSWNSYFQVVNRSISPKVGDKFELIV